MARIPFQRSILLLITVLLLTVFVIFMFDNRQPVARFSLGILFTVILWYRSDHSLARWIAILVLWLGFLLLSLWNTFFVAH
ncbi:MAG: hypothetical protein Q9P14_15055 [candidate division KSB1 bacterium]|nr:hypothetical protein [candidate division KSB1 bacterium]MDQ7065121.1 hypothetical protein [candidate division KSB1 bacterium]